MRAYEPDLIVMAVGPADGLDGSSDPGAYAVLLRDQILRLRRLAPGVPVLLLDVPDPNVRQPASPGRPRGVGASAAVQRQVAHNLGVPYWDGFSRAAAGHRHVMAALLDRDLEMARAALGPPRP